MKQKVGLAKKITKDNVFKPTRHTAETRAAITTSVSQNIVNTETELRNAKTARLRKARLEMEAQQAEADKTEAAVKSPKPSKRPRKKV